MVCPVMSHHPLLRQVVRRTRAEDDLGVLPQCACSVRWICIRVSCQDMHRVSRCCSLIMYSVDQGVMCYDPVIRTLCNDLSVPRMRSRLCLGSATCEHSAAMCGLLPSELCEQSTDSVWQQCTRQTALHHLTCTRDVTANPDL